MGYSVQRLPDEPIIVVTYTLPFDPFNDIPGSDKEANELTKDIQGNVYTISVVLALPATLDVIIDSLAQLKKTVTRDPRFARIIVANIETAKFSVDAAKQKQYGQVDLQVFGTLEEAINYSRECIAKQKNGTNLQ